MLDVKNKLLPPRSSEVHALDPPGQEVPVALSVWPVRTVVFTLKEMEGNRPKCTCCQLGDIQKTALCILPGQSLVNDTKTLAIKNLDCLGHRCFEVSSIICGSRGYKTLPRCERK